ncbi:MAG: flagellar biosynthesis anti-sigma factor FlgM [Myxococcota bacterium]|jgi:flagellar biosynthesis anti-sigma factor FlgM
MDPTRPIDSKPVHEAGRKPIHKAKAGQDAHSAPNRQGATDVAGSLSDVQALSKAVRSEVENIDSTRLAQLKDTVSRGTYRVDPEALAGRIVDDGARREVA